MAYVNISQYSSLSCIESSLHLPLCTCVALIFDFLVQNLIQSIWQRPVFTPESWETALAWNAWLMSQRGNIKGRLHVCTWTNYRSWHPPLGHVGDGVTFLTQLPNPELGLTPEWGEFLAAVDWVTLADCFVSNMRCKLGARVNPSDHK